MDESGHVAPPEVAPEKHLAELKRLLPNSNNLGEDIRNAITESKLDTIAYIARQESGNASIDAMFSVYRYLSDQLPTRETGGIIDGRAHGKEAANKAREANPNLTDVEYKKIWMTEGLKRESSYEASGMMRYLAYPEMTPTEKVLSTMMSHGDKHFGSKENAKTELMNTLDIPSEEALDKQLSAAFSGLARKELFLPPDASYEDVLKAREALFGTAPVDKDKMLAEYNKYFQIDLKSLNQIEDEINKDGIAQLKKLFGAFPIDK